VALHAAELGFVHPVTGEDILFESRLPKDFQDVLRRLGKTCGRELVDER
jgi:23S rRNA pseudouridine1911/1915/1917 synthase